VGDERVPETIRLVSQDICSDVHCVVGAWFSKVLA